jgi:hypothetical protein
MMAGQPYRDAKRAVYERFRAHVGGRIRFPHGSGSSGPDREGTLLSLDEEWAEILWDDGLCNCTPIIMLQLRHGYPASEEGSMPDWLTIDPQLQQFAAEEVSPTAMAKRLTLARQTVVDRLRKLGLKAPKQANAHTAPTAETTRPNAEDQTDIAEVLPGQMAFDAVPTEPVSGIPDISPVVMSDPLSSDEAQILAHYEEVIERGIKTFVEVGRALMTIRDRKLYRANYATFEAYCRERWDLSRPYAYQLIDASVVVENLSGITDIVPMNEAQAQPLTSLPPEEQMEVWAEVVKTAPASGVTAKHVKATVSRVKGQTPQTRTWKTAGEIAREEMAREPPDVMPKAVIEQEWLRKFDQRCVRIHEFLGELTRAGGIEVFVRGWEPHNQTEFIERATHWAKYLEEFRRHLEKTLHRA